MREDVWYNLPSKLLPNYATALYAFTNALAAVSKPDEVLETISSHFRVIFQCSNIVATRDGNVLTIHRSSPHISFGEREREIIFGVFEHGTASGYGRICYRPIQTGQVVVGVIGLESADLKQLLRPDQTELLEVFLKQAALAITRADLAKKARQAELLQETDILQKALLNSVSHNLRTPIASILGILNTVLDDGALLDDSTQQELLRTAREYAKRLNSLVQNLLDMTRLESGAIKVRPEPCDVHEIIAAALQQLGEAGHTDRINVIIEPNLPLVQLDDGLIVQVVVNVLDNAVKYSAARLPVEIEARLLAGRLNIRVLDRGPGIAEDELERVFEKFFRSNLPGGPKGLGLGLSICRGLVEAHHGQIFAGRREGGGTEVGILLPLEATGA